MIRKLRVWRSWVVLALGLWLSVGSLLARTAIISRLNCRWPICFQAHSHYWLASVASELLHWGPQCFTLWAPLCPKNMTAVCPIASHLREWENIIFPSVDRSCSLFYNLILEVTCHYFYHMLAIGNTSYDVGGQAPHMDVRNGGRDLWGPEDRLW